MKLSTNQKFFSTAAAVSVLLLTAACGSSSGSGASTSPTSSAAGSSSGSSTSNATYKDGSYSGEASYPNPAGQSKLKVDLTLVNNKVTKLNVTPEATDPTSKGHQTDFAGGVAAEVVGKNINDLKVGTIAGSSLTVMGFDKAIDQIKGEAKA